MATRVLMRMPSTESCKLQNGRRSLARPTTGSNGDFIARLRVHSVTTGEGQVVDPDITEQNIRQTHGRHIVGRESRQSRANQMGGAHVRGTSRGEFATGCICKAFIPVVSGPTVLSIPIDPPFLARSDGGSQLHTSAGLAATQRYARRLPPPHDDSLQITLSACPGCVA